MLKQVTLDRASRKKDRSVSLTFVTQLEQSSKDFMEIDELINSNGVIYFKSEGKLTDEEINEIDSVKIEVEGKSKSQRLRNVLYIYHKEQNITDKKDLHYDFKDFYALEMEKIIEHYKKKLKKD